MIKKAALIALFALIFPSNVFAATVVINEFLADSISDEGEWVELYFPSGSIDISSYYLKDAANNKKVLGSIENCGNYSVYDLVTSTGKPSDGWLNNSEQESIFLYDGNDNLIDSFENWSNPGEGKTLGRIPDGNSNWQETEKATRCQQNSQALPSPSPTPTPSLSPTPSPSTSSTSTAKSPTPTPKPTQKASATPQPSPQVLGQTQNQINSPPLPSSSPSEENAASNSKTKVAAILTGSGTILIGFSLVAYLWYRRSQIPQNADFKEEKEKDES